MNILILILILISSGKAWSATNKLWSSDQANTWQELKNTNHSFWRDLASKRNKDLYDHFGIRNGIYYLITSDVSAAFDAYKEVRWLKGRNKGGKDPNNKDWMRSHFIRLSMLYSWINDALSPEDKGNFKDILDHWTDLALNDKKYYSGQKIWGTRTWDADELMAFYFGTYLYALAIREDYPERSEYILNYEGRINAESKKKDRKFGDADDKTPGSLRSIIRNYFANLGEGGCWIESPMYSPETITYVLQAVTAINDYYKEDKFPEITSWFDEHAKQVVQSMTFNNRDYFHWGDEDQWSGITGNTTLLWKWLPFYAALSTVTKNKNAEFIFQDLYSYYPSITSNLPDRWYILVNTNRGERPSGQTSAHCSGLGFAHWHEDWSADGSFFSSMMLHRIYEDHEKDVFTNFNLWRNGKWCFKHVKGYYTMRYNAPPYHNTLLVNNFQPTQWQETRGEIDYRSGPKFVYHTGTTGGNCSQPSDLAPPESLHEWTRTHLFIHNDDDSDTIIIYDRLNAENPKMQKNYSRYRKEYKSKIEETDPPGKHRWVLYIPRGALIDWKGNTFKWKGFSDEEVILTTFMKDYRAGRDNAPFFGGESNMEDRLTKDRIYLEPIQIEGWQTLLNVLHVGSTPKITEINGSLGETAQGLFIEVGKQNIIAIFCAEDGSDELPKPSSFKGDFVKKNENRFEEQKELHYFKNTFEFQVKISQNTEMYISGLDPKIKWKASYSVGSGWNEITNFSNKNGLAVFSFKDATGEVKFRFKP